MYQIKVKVTDGGKMPTKGSEDAAAYDLYVSKDTEIAYGRQIAPTGLFMEMPRKWSADIRPRSGFSVKGMEVYIRTEYENNEDGAFFVEEKANIDADVMLGLIDSDYRGEVGVMIKCQQLDIYAQWKKYQNKNRVKSNRYILKAGTRVAQFKVNAPTLDYELVQVDELDYTHDRGGGYGHTGTE